MKKLAFLKSIKEKSVGDLSKSISNERRSIKDFLINLKLGKDKNYRKIRELKKSIARMFTLLNQKISKWKNKKI